MGGEIKVEVGKKQGVAVGCEIYNNNEKWGVMLKVVGEFQVEVHKKWDVVVKVAGEFKSQLVEKWKVVVTLGGEFQMEVGEKQEVALICLGCLCGWKPTNE